MGERRFKEIGKRKRKFLALLTVFMLVVGALGVNAEEIDIGANVPPSEKQVTAGNDSIKVGANSTFDIVYKDGQGDILHEETVGPNAVHSIKSLHGRYDNVESKGDVIDKWYVVSNTWYASAGVGAGVITLKPKDDQTTYIIFRDSDDTVLESHMLVGNDGLKYPAYSGETPTKEGKKFVKWIIENKPEGANDYSVGALVDESDYYARIFCKAVYEDIPAPDPGKGSYSVSGTVRWRKGSSKPAEAIVEGTGADGRDSWLHFTQDGNVTGRVSIDGQELTYGSDWNAHQGNSTHIEIAAEVLEQYKANSTHTIKVTFDDGEADVTLKILSGNLRYLDDGIHYDDDSSDPEPTNPVAPATGKITPKTGEV